MSERPVSRRYSFNPWHALRGLVGGVMMGAAASIMTTPWAGLPLGSFLAAWYTYRAFEVMPSE